MNAPTRSNRVPTSEYRRPLVGFPYYFSAQDKTA